MRSPSTISACPVSAPAGSTGTIHARIDAQVDVVACDMRRHDGRRRSRACPQSGPKKSPAEAGLLPMRDDVGQRLTVPSPLTSTSTRRFGARQAISSFSAFWLQTTPGTGCVLPMPSVSILSRGTPLLTR